MSKYIDAEKMLEEYEHGIYDTTDLAEMLYYMPAADVQEVKHGRWLEEDWTFNYVCSVCHHQGSVNKTDYCPNCGASMVNEDE